MISVLAVVEKEPKIEQPASGGEDFPFWFEASR
jgi:hypothetical protein